MGDLRDPLGLHRCNYHRPAPSSSPRLEGGVLTDRCTLFSKLIKKDGRAHGNNH